MRFPSLTIGFVVALALGFAMPAFAADSSGGGSVDCSYNNIKPKDTAKKVDPDDVSGCIIRAWDPPVAWRQNEGVSGGIRVQGGGGYSHGIIQAPDEPPWKTDAPASISQQSQDFYNNFPPKINIGIGGSGSGSGSSSSSSSSSSSGGGSCPTSNDDTDTAYGVKQPLAGGALSLGCGGAIPLTTYQMAISKGADSLLITEYGQYYYWVYRRNGNAYNLVSQQGAHLPTTLCGGATLQPPIAQMISFSSQAGSVALRLQPTGAPPSDPLDPPATPEKFLILPLNNGTPQVPADCVGSDSYQPTKNIGDIVFQAALNSGCEAPPATCQQQGLSSTPTTLPSCVISTIYPTGSVCSKDIQMALVDRPNLIYASGNSPVIASIDGLTAFMAGTAGGSYIVVQDSAIMNLGNTATLTFHDGATIGLTNGGRLVLSGPATINAATNTITLPNGGLLKDKSGTMVKQYPSNTTLSPSDFTPIQPYVLDAVGDVDMPSGYMVPTSPDGKVRLPIVTP